MSLPNIGPSKTRLVTDLDDAYKRLNTTLATTAKLSDQIANGLNGGGGGNNAANSMANMTPPPPPPGMGNGPGGSPGPGGPYGPNNNAYTNNANQGTSSSRIASMAGTAFAAINTAVNTDDIIANQRSRTRFGFFNGQGGVNSGATAFQNLQNMGTANSSLDAAAASMAGNSVGLMAGLSNYGTIQKSTAGISNLLPGIGLEASMGATAALNQGSSVNKLRMIGINVRDQNGYMRDVEAIARDLWKMINGSKTGGSRKISVQDLSFSLQSGNSLDMLLNQYFGTDQVLRQAIISYLYQFAQESGAPVGGYSSEAGKNALSATGASNELTRSYSKRYAAEYGLTNAITTAGASGIEQGNTIIAKATNYMISKQLNVVNGLVETMTTAETLAGALNGAFGMLLGGAAEVSSFIKKGLQVAGLIGLATNVYKNVFGSSSSGSSGSSNSSGPVKLTPTSSTPSIKGINADATPYYTDFAVAMLHQLGDKVTNNNVSSLVSWMQHESTQAKLNPLGSTYTIGNAPRDNFNSTGVQNYYSASEAVTSTVANLTNKRGVGYEKILTDLQNNAAPSQTLKDVANSAWSGSGHYGHAFVTFNLPNVTNLDHPDVQKALTDWWNSHMSNKVTKGT
jgi:hypothetical protein